MNFIRSKLEIDWLSFSIKVNHDAKKISDGSIIYSNVNISSFDDFKKIDKNNLIIKCKPKDIVSEHGKLIELNSIDGKRINIKGNIFKWLYGQNVTGESNLISLIVKFVETLRSDGLVNPTEEQLIEISNGDFRVYRVDVKQDLIFNNKDNALRYLDHIKKLGYYRYKEKKEYSNGCYFGMDSRTRWSLLYYHKGNELRDKNQRFKVGTELYALSELMIRSEIRIHNAQLKEWNLMYGWQWKDLHAINTFFTRKFSDLQLPNINERNQVLDISSKTDRKFYSIIKDKCPEDYYSRATIHQKRIKFMNDYGIDIYNL